MLSGQLGKQCKFWKLLIFIFSFESNHFHVDVDTGLEVGTKLLELGVTDIDTGKNQLVSGT